MTREQFVARFPHASKSCLQQNALLWNWPPESTPTTKRRTLARILTDTYVQPPKSNAASENRSSPQGTQLEHPFQCATLASPQGETLYTGRVSISITSYRRRLCDVDNLVGKWFLDACRYSKLIRDDRPEDISYSICQKKVETKEEERTEIEITPL